MYDMIIIGGGPGGYVAAIRGAQLGAKVVLIEKEALGGVCLNRGCIPTKALLHGANLYHEIKNAGEFGIDVTPPVINFSRMIGRKNRIVKTLNNGIQGLMKKNGVEVIQGEADLISEHEVKVKDVVFLGKNIIIAVGSSPNIIPIPGSNDPIVITSDEALSLTELPKSMAIIGGGVVGVEMAVLFQSLGCKTTIVEMMDRLVPMMDDEVSKMVLEMLKKTGVEVYTGSKVESIQNGILQFQCEDNTKQLIVSKILMAVGRRSNGLKLSLDKIGIKHQNGVIETNSQMRTNIPNIYAIGDVNGLYMLAHVASVEGIVAAETIMGRERFLNYQAIPQCIYTYPEVAVVGLTEEQAKKDGYQLKISRVPLMANGKALTEGHNKGFIKIIADELTEKVLGMHMIAPHATEMITMGTMVINLNVCAPIFGETIFPHPTISEMILEAAHGVIDHSIHI